MENLLLNLGKNSSGDFPDWAGILIIVAFFGLIVLTVIIVKKKVKPLQIKKPEISEEESAKEELDRILIPVDEETQKQMDEAMKNDGNDEE